MDVERATIQAMSAEHVVQPRRYAPLAITFVFFLTREVEPCEEKSGSTRTITACCVRLCLSDRSCLAKTPAHGTQPLHSHCVTIQISDRYQSLVRKSLGDRSMLYSSLLHSSQRDIEVIIFGYLWFRCFEIRTTCPILVSFPSSTILPTL